MFLYWIILGALSLPQIQVKFLSKLTNWMSISRIKSPWRENPNLIKERKIVANEQEFRFSQNNPYLFLDETTTEVYSWERLKYFLIAEKGVILEFTPKKRFSEKKLRFIPRRILAEKQLQELVSSAQQHGLQLGLKKSLKS